MGFTDEIAAYKRAIMEVGGDVKPYILVIKS